MTAKTLLLLVIFGMWTSVPAWSQNTTEETEKTKDTPQSNRFWQASLPGGQYMVALDRISSVSRHRYLLLDGSAIVDEVTIDALGQSLARFYYIAPATDAATGSATGKVVSGIVNRAEELVDKAAGTVGTDIHLMVIKKFPETTHARTVEYRLLSAGELGDLHQSIRSAWESGRGRKFAVK